MKYQFLSAPYHALQTCQHSILTLVLFVPMINRIQVKMARAALGWGVRELAARAGIAANTVSRYENGADALGDTLLKIQRTFEQAGIEFIDQNGGGLGVRLRNRAED
jgi:DNA-binding XRE family transcriptional regulator